MRGAMGISWGLIFFCIVKCSSLQELIYFDDENEGISSLIHYTELMYSATKQINKALVIPSFQSSTHYSDVGSISLCDIFVLPADMHCINVNRTDYLSNHSCVNSMVGGKVVHNIPWKTASCVVAVPHHFLPNSLLRMAPNPKSFPFILTKKYVSLFHSATTSFFKGLPRPLVVVHWRRGDMLTIRCPHEKVHSFNCDSVDKFVLAIKSQLDSRGIKSGSVYVATNEKNAASLNYIKDMGWKTMSDLNIPKQHNSLDLFLIELQVEAHADVFLHEGVSGIPKLARELKRDFHLSSNVLDPYALRQDAVIHSPEECKLWFGNRSYVPPSRQNEKLAYLYTFPGSGNTWCRLLLEYATGYYTGSLYNDPDLQEVLPGEGKCGPSVAAVKAHPNHFSAEVMLHQGRPSHCGEGGGPVANRLQKAVLVFRNPFEAIWSAYERLETLSHAGDIPQKNFNWTKWEIESLVLANSYNKMWTKDYKLLVETLPKEDVLFIRFEDLINPHKRYMELGKMDQFLDIDSAVKPGVGNPFHSIEDMQEQKLSCAFMLAESDNVHRPKFDENKLMRENIAYTPEIVCKIWAVLGDISLQYGYGIWKNINCKGVKY